MQEHPGEHDLLSHGELLQLSQPETEQWTGIQGAVELPSLPERLPILALRTSVVFPGVVAPLRASRTASLQALRLAVGAERLIAIATQWDAAVDEPGPADFQAVGTVARILKLLERPDGSARVLVQGLGRIRWESIDADGDILQARATPLTENAGGGLDGLRMRALAAFARFVDISPAVPNELAGIAAGVESPGRVADLVAAHLTLPPARRYALLEEPRAAVRLAEVAEQLEQELELLELGHKIEGEVRNELDRNQKEFYLRQQLQAIRRELGEGDPRSAELEALRRRIDAAGAPLEARGVAERELDRLAAIPVESAEHSQVRTYVEWIADLPWSVATSDDLNLARVRAVLDEDHYGLDKVKERILELLAVRRLRRDARGPILCLAGPPGVGKTSLGRSIARALGRRFQRISLGGVRDEAEIRGHRRTYVGAMPGRIVQALKNAGAMNPVLLLDEIDKLGADRRGDPASALLEVLDPEQNRAFRDHYLEVDVDLSRVLFLTTANYLDPIPAALADRMEVVELPGYDREHKLEIARRHLVPRQLTEAGLPPNHARFDDAALAELIEHYTREAGLRNLDRQLASICRKLARRLVEGACHHVTVDAALVGELLGPRTHETETHAGSYPSGVATGLAWTPAGGEVLVVEASMMAGRRHLALTGQLGDVMKESAQAALTWLRSHCEELGLEAELFERSDLHVHVPAGAIPKDGPSAGVTILAALASALTGRSLRPGLAMTGELTLRGSVLGVGGVVEKVLAARRAGLREIWVPEKNRRQIEEMPAHLREGLEFRFVADAGTLLHGVLGPEPARTRKAAAVG